MNRERKNNLSPISNYDLSPFMPQNNSTNKFAQFEHDSIDTLREKLQIKSEALNLLAKQLEQCNKEKIEYKQLIDTLYDKNLSLKTALYYKENEIDNPLLSDSLITPRQKTKLKSSKTFHNQSNIIIQHQQQQQHQQPTIFNDIDSEDYMKVLKDLVKILQKEKYELIQKYEQSQQELNDSKMDLRLLREQLVRQRIGSVNEGLTTSPSMTKVNKQNTSSNNQIDTSSSSSLLFSNRVESLIKDIELLREQKSQLENDLKIFICQKEELEIERDTFKEKYNKLNEFLVSSSMTTSKVNVNDNDSLNSNKVLRKVQLSLNIDELISKNNYLNESNKNLKDELEILKSSMKKLKQNSKLDDNFTSKTNNSNLIINKKKILQILAQTDMFLSQHKQQNQQLLNESVLNQSIELILELKSLIESLLESLNDKITANLHQRKVNKMLANRIQDLEKEISNYLESNNKLESKQKFKLKSFDELDVNSYVDNAAVPVLKRSDLINDSNNQLFKLTDLNDSVSLISFKDDNKL